MKYQRYTGISIAAALLLAGCSRHTDVKLGFVGPLSGPLAEIGGDMFKGAQIAVDELNEESFVVDGKRARFELVVEDDASNADQGKAAVEHLVASKVAGAIGHFNSGVAIPTAQLFAQAGIPEFSLATNPKYTHMGYPTAFRILADDDAQIAALVETATNSLKAGHNSMVIDDDCIPRCNPASARHPSPSDLAGAPQVSQRRWHHTGAITFCRQAAPRVRKDANQKGPHWADPLKAWGDALVKQSYPKDALAKYDEALKYAPSWKQLKEARETAAKVAL